MTNEEYRKAYMEGYVAGLEKGREESEKELKPIFKNKDIMERYGIGRGKASEVIRAVRHVSGGGGFGTAGMVKRSELLYWESIVDKTFLARLYTSEAK